MAAAYGRAAPSFPSLMGGWTLWVSVFGPGRRQMGALSWLRSAHVVLLYSPVLWCVSPKNRGHLLTYTQPRCHIQENEHFPASDMESYPKLTGFL